MTMLEHEIDKARALAAFTRQFSAMVDVGIHLARCLAVLAVDGSEPYDSFCRQLSARWSNEDPVTLCDAMAEYPDLFSPFYVKTIRCGEVMGVLEESLGQLAELIEDMVRMWTLNGRPIDWLRPVLPGDREVVEDWFDLDWRHRRFILMVMCRSLGQMLASGVPFLTAANAVADFLPVRQRDEFIRDLTEHVKAGRNVADYLSAAGLDPQFVVNMVSIGEQVGNLDIILQKIALAYQKQLEMEAL